ncbi:putative copper-transporting ATPase HMA5 [Camellia lanceoleosa]|uniref:Copper-transporting ATPase HMA5 n=1 Tax=Camellia lanceoleosa TaxID=1840588 RepID=A0ACC0FJS5_9ERIC|nr:putative copper-transporting ATPase HMA5 [Camellia lanceoleosa]
MPKYPKAKGVLVSKDDHDDEDEEEEEKKNSEASEEEEEVMMALYSVIGMNCSACSRSEAIKRLPGIKDAVVDVFNNSARVFFYPPFVDKQ